MFAVFIRSIPFIWPFLRELLVGGGKNTYTNRRKTSGVGIALIVVALVAIGDMLAGIGKDKELSATVIGWFVDTPEKQATPTLSTSELRAKIRHITSDLEYERFLRSTDVAKLEALQRQLNQCRVGVDSNAVISDGQISLPTKESLSQRAASKLSGLNNKD